MLKIIISNTRKHKASMIALFMLVLMGSMLLCIGLSVSGGIDEFYYNKVNELDSPNISYYINTPDFDEFITKATDFEDIDEWKTSPVLSRSGVKFKQVGKNASASFFFRQVEADQSMSPLVIIDEITEKPDNFIILPQYLKSSYEKKSGDIIDMEISGKSYQFKICGFFEDVFYGNPILGNFTAYISDKMYTEIENGTEQSYILEIKTQNAEASSAKAVLKHLKKTTDEVSPTSYTAGISLELARQGGATPIGIMGMMLIGFSFIVVIVSLIVISFSINTAVEDGIREIGIMKAGGYKSFQIIVSIVLQYGSFSALGTIIGIALSVTVLPFIGTIIASTVGLIWNLVPNAIYILGTFSIVITLVILVSILQARKIHKITPIMALRNDIETHNFKHNFFPLSKSKLNINYSIALKYLMQGLKQNVITVVIVAAVSFAAVFSVQLYSNMVEDTSALKYMLGLPLGDVWVLSDSQKSQNMLNEISKMEEVSQTTRVTQMIISYADNDLVSLLVSDDFDSIDRKTIVQGRYPKSSNEISVSNTVAKSLNKKLGDVAEFSMFGKTEEYLIVGITEQMANMGAAIDLTESGMKKLYSDYKINGMIFDLKDDVNTNDFIKKIEFQYADTDKTITNIMEFFDNQIGALTSGVTAVVALISVVMVFVVVLILYMLIKTKILRDKINIGTLKALGFTSMQIVLQIALCFSFVILIGSTLGGILGGAYINRIFAVLLSSMGISNAHFVTNYIYTAYLVIGITIISYVVSSFVASKVKKITPRNLLIE